MSDIGLLQAAVCDCRMPTVESLKKGMMHESCPSIYSR